MKKCKEIKLGYTLNYLNVASWILFRQNHNDTKKLIENNYVY